MLLAAVIAAQADADAVRAVPLRERALEALAGLRALPAAAAGASDVAAAARSAGAAGILAAATGSGSSSGKGSCRR
jgi:hypothetical protein